MTNISSITPQNAKKIIANVLNKEGFNNKLTARTLNFSDLARDKVVFVEVHNWKADPIWFELKRIAVRNGFRIICSK